MVARFLALAALVVAGCDHSECKCADTATPDATDTADADATDTSVDAPDDTTEPAGVFPGATALAGPAVRFSHARADFFDAPVPALDLFVAGHPDLAGWPREASGFVDGLAQIAETTDGASLAGAIYFAFDAAPPTGLSGTIIDVDTASSERGLVRTPTTTFETDGGPHGAPFMLSLYPTQGLALRPRTTYLALALADGSGFGRAQELADLLAGRAVPTLGAGLATYRAALRYAVDAGLVDATRIVGVTVFTTADPVSELGEFVLAASAEPRPDMSGFALTETYDRYCVYTKTITLPDYQHGNLPFSNPGEGTWQRDANGKPEVARRAESRVFLTIPRKSAPTAGFPTVVFIRTGGGGDRPLIDRGPRAVAHGEPIVPRGAGPAGNLAAAGWAGITWDGPHGGPRNPNGSDEQFLMFNVTNPAGTRDNIRQTALEAVLVRDLLADLEVDTSGCEGAATTSRFDDDRSAIMGHSMGAWVAPIALANSDKFETAILSGAGGSWSANIVYKKSPLDVRPLAEQILGYSAIGRALAPADPALTLLQWAGEAADPQSYAHLARTPQRNILMIEGIVDTYILPPIANTTSLSLGLDLASPAYDDSDPRLADFAPLIDLMSGTQRLPPMGDNRSGHTAVVVQAPGDAIEDGHEAMFQTPGPKLQYRCFLETLVTDGVPTVVAPGGEWDPCR